ncbi:hypothetical protein [Pseudomonas sp. LB3P25]
MFLDNNKAFTANLYVNGLPLVLNQQRLKLRLRDPRITRREQLDVEVALADRNGSSFVTLADHEDDKPLLLKFVPHGDNYVVTVVLRGIYEGWRLKIEGGTHHLSVSDNAPSDYFSIRKNGVPKAGLADLAAGPSYVHLVSEANKHALYRAKVGGNIIFKDVDPNVTGHDAFNSEPATFVLKIIDKPTVVEE